MEAQEDEQEVPILLVTHVKNVSNSVFLKCQHLFKCWSPSTISIYSNQMGCMRTFHTFPTTSKEPSLNTGGFILRGVRLWRVYGTLCLNLFSQGEGKCLVDPMVSCCMENWGLIFSPLLICYIQTWNLGYDWLEPDLIFFMISYNLNLCFGIVGAHSTLVVLLSRMIITRKEWTYLHSHILRWSSTFWKLQRRLLSFPLDKTNSFNYFFNEAQIRRVAIAMNTQSALTGSHTESPFSYHQFDFRQMRMPKNGQPFLLFDAADSCRLYVTTMKAMNFQVEIPSMLIDKFKDHYVLVFDLTSMHDATKKCSYPDFVGEPLRLELNFTLPLEHVTELIVLGERMSSVAVDKFGVVGIKI